MLRSKFWSGLKISQLRNATRHKYESVKEFHSLLREVRQIEQEENDLLTQPLSLAFPWQQMWIIFLFKTENKKKCKIGFLNCLVK